VIDVVETDQRREHADIRLSESVAGKIALLAEHCIPVVECFEQLVDSLVVRCLGVSEPGTVDAIVDRLIDGVDYPVNLLSIAFRVEVHWRIEGDIQHPEDLLRLVVDGGVVLAIPQYRDGDVACVVGVGCGVDLVEIVGVIDGVVGTPVLVRSELPAVLLAVRVKHVDSDRLFQPQKRSGHERPVCPGAGEANVQVISAPFGRERRITVGFDPTVETGRLALDLTAIAG
jgi:hypothetical protein